MYAIGSSSAKPSAMNSGRFWAEASTRRASSSERRFAGRRRRGQPATMRSRQRGWVHRLPDQALLRARQPGGRAPAKSRAPSKPQTVGQRENSPDRDDLFTPTRGPLPPGAGAVVPLTRDGAPPAGRERPQPGARRCGAFRRSMANASPEWRTCSLPI
jgi:hypothetical protein